MSGRPNPQIGEPATAGSAPPDELRRNVARELDPTNAANDVGGGPPFIPFWMRKKLIHNEQAKLTATALNNISVAFLVTAILTPLVTYAQNPTTITKPEALLVGFGWLLTSVILHQLARLILTGLEP